MSLTESQAPANPEGSSERVQPTDAELVHLIGLTSSELTTLMTERGQPAYRGKQIARWLYSKRAASPSMMTDLPASLRTDLDTWAVARTLSAIRMDAAADGAIKYALQLRDGLAIEAVYLPYQDRVSVCLSSQVGCPAGCTFCATARMGLKRQLTAGEIVEQYLWLQDAQPNRRISHAVFMGMGEPLLNVEAVIQALRVLIVEVQVSARNLTVSTVGAVPGMLRLAESGLPVNLALSLHAPNDGLRAQLVPTARAWPLLQILSAADQYRLQTGRDVTYEYVLINNVNDSEAHARALTDLLDGHSGSVNLIPYNPVKGIEVYEPSTSDRIGRFRRILVAAGRTVTQRMRRGLAVSAACGQLAGAGGAKTSQRHIRRSR